MNFMINSKVFDKKQTNIAKGIAILLMLWHHLFFNNPDYYDKYISLFWINNIPLASIISIFCKVCVAIFLLLSGYGLYISFCSYESKNSVNGKLPVKLQIIFVKNHLIKLMFEYWFIYIIFVGMGFFMGRPVFTYFGYNILYYIVDFLGLSNLFAFPTMNGAWWFMSVIIVIYLLFPLLIKAIRKIPELLLICSFAILFITQIPSFAELKLWLFPFVLGMYLSKYDGLCRIGNKLQNKINAVLVCGVTVVTLALLRYKWFDNFEKIDGLFALAIIITSFTLLSKVPVLNKILEEFGKYSGAIFMFHSFIFSYYFKDFIYWFKYPIIIFVVLVVVCYAIARLLEVIKKIIRYDKLVQKLT